MRVVWLQGRLDERKEVWGLFPAAWRVPHVLCLTFCKITKVWWQSLPRGTSLGYSHLCAPRPVVDQWG
jgi:hypothetical protein